MNMQHEVPDVPPASIRVAPSSLPGGPAQASCLHECAPVHVQQQDNPFDIMTIPIVGDHPLQNFARYQTVYVTQSGSGASKQYTYKSPPMNAFAIDVSNKEWLSAMVRSPGLLAEGFDFKVRLTINCWACNDQKRAAMGHLPNCTTATDCVPIIGWLSCTT